jgi:hypothetical protein
MRTTRSTAGRARTTRIVGALLVLAAAGGWVTAGTPWPGSAPFGDVPAADGTPPPPPAPAPPAPAQPAPAPGPATGPAADRAAAPQPVAPEPTEPPRYTTTVPRGPIDPQRWPTGVRVPALDVDAPVQPVGVGPAGVLIVPPSPMDVGWYQGGAVPGEPGVALLTSHVDTRTEGRGVFAGLVRLDAGDTVMVTAADGSTQRWTVTARTQHRKEDLPEALFARSGPPVLALVTCGGPFDRDARRYRDNVIVWASPAP